MSTTLSTDRIATPSEIRQMDVRELKSLVRFVKGSKLYNELTFGQQDDLEHGTMAQIRKVLLAISISQHGLESDADRQVVDELLRGPVSYVAEVDKLRVHLLALPYYDRVIEKMVGEAYDWLTKPAEDFDGEWQLAKLTKAVEIFTAVYKRVVRKIEARVRQVEADARYEKLVRDAQASQGAPKPSGRSTKASQRAISKIPAGPLREAERARLRALRGAKSTASVANAATKDKKVKGNKGRNKQP